MMVVDLKNLSYRNIDEELKLNLLNIVIADEFSVYFVVISSIARDLVTAGTWH